MGKNVQGGDVSRSADRARRKAGGRSTVRRVYRITLAAAAICSLAACHGSSATSAASAPVTDTDAATVSLPTYYNPPLQTGTALPTDADPASTANGSVAEDPTALTDIGTLTVATTGSSVSTSLSVGPATTSATGKPPADVMDACNWGYAPTLAKSVFIHGKVTIQYTGSLPEEVSIATPSLVDLKNGYLLDAGVALQDTDGSWGNCGGFGTTLQPGQSVTTEMWVDYQLLSNAHPTFSPSDLDGLALQSGAVDSDEAGLGIGNTTTASGGSGASICTVAGDDPKATLLFYSTPPYSYTTHNETGTQLTGECNAP